ncbi:MAG: hypothetical protein ACM3Q2_07935 [Syntrophothermus sp.]
MGLLPIIFSTLSIFVVIVAITLFISYIMYKVKSPKKLPYMMPQPAYIPKPVYKERSQTVIYTSPSVSEEQVMQEKRERPVRRSAVSYVNESTPQYRGGYSQPARFQVLNSSMVSNYSR